MEIFCPVKVIPWKVFMDGAFSALGARAEIMVITPEGIKLEHSFRLGFKSLITKPSMRPCLPD